jgi:hypothetical protein
MAKNYGSYPTNGHMQPFSAIPAVSGRTCAVIRHCCLTVAMQLALCPASSGSAADIALSLKNFRASGRL